MLRRKFLAGIAAVAASAALAGTVAVAPSAGAASTGRTNIYLVHGIPAANGLPVDIYMAPTFQKGVRVFRNVKFGTIAGPFNMPSGGYVASIRPAGAPGNSTPLLSLTTALPKGANVTAVAHLDATGNPKVSAFVNDISRAGAGNGRVVVRHLAAAPAVDVKAGTATLFAGVVNGQEGKMDVPAGAYPVSVVGAAGTAIAGVTAFSGVVPVKAGQSINAFAVGVAGTASFRILLQGLPLRK